jgi:sterol desaturase/sphingolipid hydroxylase (fatty acid hydroxylase superfamily)
MIVATILAALASFAVLAAIFVPLERAFPARAQKITRPEWHVDVVFFLGQYFAWSGASLFIIGVVASFVPRLELFAGVPLAVKVVLAVAGGDFVVYWFHRACHAWEPLWRFHAVHHSAEHLDWIAAHREHPVDGILTQTCMNLPAIALGVPIEALAGVAMFRGIWAIFVHSNVRLPLGPLRFLLGAPELHHWHHAKVEKTEHNFANLGPWLDVLFGTYHRPTATGGEETYALGITDPSPRGYVGQLVHPFRVLVAALGVARERKRAGA